MRQRVMIAIALACGPEAAVRRRADDRARRHRAGADPRPAAGAAARAVHGDGARHPRPRRRRRPRRRHRGDVRGPDRREGADARRCSRRCATRTPRRCCSRSRSSRSRATRGSTRSAAGRPTSSTRRPAASSRPRCPYAQAQVPQRGAAARRRRRRPATSSAAGIPVGTEAGQRRARAQPRRGRDRGRACRCAGSGGAVVTSGWSPDGRQRDRAPAPRRTRRCCGSRTSSSSSRSGARGLKVHAVSDVSLDVLRGRDARPRRRVGLRQVDDRQGDHAAAARRSRARCCFDGADLTQARRATSCARTRTRMQMIFQDPISSLNPRRKVEDIVAEGLQIWKIGTEEEQQKKVDEVMLDGRPRSRRCSAAGGRTSSPAVSASASRSRARSSPTRSSSSATSRSPRSTCRCRRRSSTCSRT